MAASRVLALRRRFFAIRANLDLIQWVDGGVQMTLGKELLRHSDIQTTMNVYTQAMSATKRRAAEKVQSILLGKKSGRSFGY